MRKETRYSLVGHAYRNDYQTIKQRMPTRNMMCLSHRQDTLNHYQKKYKPNIYKQINK